MSFIDSLKGLFQKQVNPAIFGFFANSSMPKMGEKEFLKAYRGWVYACVNAISQPISEMEIKLEQKGKDGWQEIEQNPALDILHNVNDFMSYGDLMYGTQAFIELTGNHFWYIAKNQGGKIAEIWPLDPTRTQVVKSRKSFIEGYIFTSDMGQKVPFKTDEIVHFKTFNPRDAYRGMGTVEAAALAIDTDTYASEWQRNFFGNSAQPSGILSSEGTMTQEQYDRIKINWEERHRGIQNANKMAILEGGLKWTPITPTSKEMQFTDSRKDVRDEILAIFRVPKPILGILEDINLASAQVADLIFMKYTEKPKMTNLVGKLNEAYLPLWGLDQKTYRFNFKDPVPENLDQKRLDRESGIKNYYMTPNEAREQVGLKPVPGGDVIYVPASLVPLGTQPKEEDPKDNGNTNDKPKEDEGKDDKKWVKGVRKIYKIGKPPKNAKYINAQTKVMHEEYATLNTKLKKQILKKLSSKAVTPEIYKDWLFPERKENNLVNLIFQKYGDWVGLVLDATTEGLQRIFEQSGKDGIAETGVDIEFDLKNPRAVKWIESHALEATDSYSGTMKQDITFILQQGIDEGVSVQEIARSIEQFFDDESDYRALRIARTETITGYAQGNLEGYRQSGVVSGKKWLPDSEACPICVANANAGTIGIDENFPSGDDAPAAHPNCECALQPVVKSELDEG